ncbi:MAG: hypothetical protein JXR19_01905 [Bacteroidia bacterium]
MKQFTLLFLLAFPLLSMAQEARGSFGLGYYRACPQNGLKAVNYDDGHGMHFTFLSRKYPFSTMSFQYGGRLDFASMGSKDFEPVLLDVPNEDYGDLEVRNSMFGLFGLARVNFGQSNLQPFFQGQLGYRTFNTQQNITAQHPERNLQFESFTQTDKVVYTNRFHYGATVGVTYQLNRSIILESSVTYTEGETGAVMPLEDIYQTGPVLKYPHVFSETDMLLINAGIRFQFYRHERKPRTGTSPTKPSTPTYKDPPIEKDPPPPPPPPPIEKRKLEPKKNNKPKKNDTTNS